MARRSVVSILINAKDRTGTAFKGATGGLRKLGKAIVSVKGLMVGLAGAAVIRGGQKLVSMFNQQERAVLRLNQVLANTGRYTKEASTALAQRAAAIQRETIHGDEAILEAVGRTAELATELTTDQLAVMQEAIVGLGDTFFKGDLSNAALLLGKTLASPINALARYGIQLDGATTQQEKFLKIMEVTGNFFQTSKAAARDLGGQIVQAKNAFGDLQETLGEVIVEVFNLRSHTGSLRDRFVAWEESVQSSKKEIVKWGKVTWAVVKALVTSIVQTFRTAFNLGEVIGSILLAASSRLDYWLQEIRLTLFDGVNAIIEGLNKIPKVNLGLIDTSRLQARSDEAKAMFEGAREAVDKNVDQVVDGVVKVKDAWVDLLDVASTEPELTGYLRDPALLDPAIERLKQLAELDRQLGSNEILSVGQSRTDAQMRQEAAFLASREDTPQTTFGFGTDTVTGMGTSETTFGPGEQDLLAMQGPLGEVNTALEYQVTKWNEIGHAITEATTSQMTMAQVVGDIMTSVFNDFGDAVESAFQNVVEGSKNAGQAFGQAMLGAVASVASGMGKFYLLKATAAIGEGLMGNPAAFVAAAKFTAAATGFFALAGALKGLAGGGSGGGGSQAATAQRQDDLAGSASRGDATLVIEGDFLDMNNPVTEERFRKALEDLSGRRVTVEHG